MRRGRAHPRLRAFEREACGESEGAVGGFNGEVCLSSFRQAQRVGQPTAEYFVMLKK